MDRKYTAKYKMDREANVFWAKRNLIDYIWKSANLEGIAVTFPDTEAIYHGVTVPGCSVEDVVKINNLKHAWQFLFDTLDYPLDYAYICRMHQIVGANSIYNAGYIRSFPVSMGGTSWIPDIPIESVVKEELQDILGESNPMDRALDVTMYLMRKQMFPDGNKRVAMLAGNQILVSEGMGILSVKQEDLKEFGQKLISFYETNEKEPLKAFLYEKCIDGENIVKEVQKDPNMEKPLFTEEYFRKKSKEFSKLGQELTPDKELEL